MIRNAAAAAAASALVLGGAATAQPSGEAVFQRCAACHLPDGAGVPGAFPALRGQVGRFAAVGPGRAYLVSVVTHGLTGGLTLDGAAYAGFMPAQSLSDDEAAAVLNYVVRLAAPSARTKPFTAAEVAAIRARAADPSAQGSRALRPDSLAGGR